MTMRAMTMTIMKSMTLVTMKTAMIACDLEHVEQSS